MEDKMFLTIKTERQGLVSKVPLNNSSGSDESIHFYEDESCSMELVCEASLGIPTLYLEDYELGDPYIVKDGDIIHWRWDSRPYFQNCFGLARLRVEFSEGAICLTPYLEVLAKKLSTEQISSMIEYLYSRSFQLIQACFSKTGVGTSQGENALTVEHTIRVAEDAVVAIEELLFVKPQRIRKRLVESRKVKAYSPRDVVDDRSILHILQHLNKASVVPDPNHPALPVDIQGKRVYYQELDVVEKTESSNVYENGIIHGFLLSMITRLLEIESYLADVYQKINRHMESGGYNQNDNYMSFASLCGYHLGKLSERPRKRVSQLVERVNACRRQAEQMIPAKPVRQAPRNTPWFSAYPKYRRIFVQAKRWYKMGEHIADVSQVLLRLKTVDRLYEYLCLFQLLELLESEGWTITGAERTGGTEAMSDPVNNRYLFTSHHGELELLYEPRIHSFNSGGGELWNLVKVSGKSELPFVPDFMIRISQPATNQTHRVALDAKYGTQKSIGQYHLPQLVLKYNFGISYMGDLSQPPFKHIWILAPQDRSFSNYQWQYPKAGTSRTSLGVIGILPDNHYAGLRKWYREVLLPSIKNNK